MPAILTPLIPVLVVFVGLVPSLALLHFWSRRKRARDRRSPLTRELLRPPGHSLRAKIEQLDEEINLCVLAFFLVPILIFAIHVSQSYFGKQAESVWRIAISLAFVGMAAFLTTRRFTRLTKDRRSYVLGLEGEQATGEELNQLMLLGCRVFHDVPFPYGNIDHVVVSPSGVYSVNTKCLGKLPEGNGSAEVLIDHEENVVRFPDWTYPIPVDQLTTEAKWLSKELSESVGQVISVEPMLALPGWFVKSRIGRSEVYVINPLNPHKFFIRSRRIFSDEMIRRIAHQLEQKCRDVEPSFWKEKRWEERA